MTSDEADTEPDAERPGGDEGRKATFIIASAAGVTAMSFNVWYPFMPLYALELGATSDADAAAWIALAVTSQGVARIASSALWGFLSDRWGRKLMLLRALYLASITFAFAAIAQEPWHLAVALACQGLFSGFIPASVALVSVSVPDHRLNRSLSTVTGAQYLGSTLGPGLGALLALFLGFRESIIVAAFVPLITATSVLLWVPRDQVVRRRTATADGETRNELEPFKVTGQFVLAVGALFFVYSMNEMVRLSTPIALRVLQGGGDVALEAGIAFSLGGLASAISVLLIAPRVFRPGRVRQSLGGACALGAAGCAILVLTNGVPMYIAGFVTVSLVISVMVPAINTLIASSVTRSRRGTGFGIAATVQALSFAVGPGSAALFVSVSLNAGFGVVCLIFLSLGVVLFSAVREAKAASA